MELESFNQSLSTLVQVVLLDLLLSGDNALVIALVCNGLPEALRRRAVLLATGLAIGLRLVLTLLIGILLYVPLLKLIGAILLLVIAIRLLLGDEQAGATPARPFDSRLATAVVTVVTADAAMSLDNVMGLAGAAQGNLTPLLLGLLLSIPLLMYGSLYLSRLLEKAPWLIPLGSAVLAWVAGRLSCSDPLWADWIDEQAPALQVALPICCVVFALFQTRIIRQQRDKLGPCSDASPSWIERNLGRFGERLLGPQRELSDSIMAAQPAPLADQPPLSRPISPAPDQSQGVIESNWGMHLLMWASLAICLAAILWLGAHLLGHGLLPAPRGAT